MEDQDQDVYGVLEKKKKHLKDKIKPKLSKCKDENKKAETNNVKECRVAEANRMRINEYRALKKCIR